MVIGFLLLFVVLLLYFYKDDKKNFRPLTVLAYTVLAYVASIYIFNEVFSLGKMISFYSILGFWCFYDICLFLVYRNLTKDKKDIKKLISNLKTSFNNNKIYYIISFIVSLMVIVVAICTVPYNYDSHTYHLTRVAMWFKNGCVAHFATTDTRMLGSPPLKEFVDLHIYGLLGNVNDNFLNLTQTISFILNSLFVLEIADRIGCKKKGKILAVVAFISTATVLAEAFTTQTDEFASLFVLAFIILVLDVVKNQKFTKIDKKSVFSMLTLGLCIGLAYLAKPSGLFAIAVFTIYLMVDAIKKKAKVPVFMRWLIVTGAFTAIVASPELIRNYNTYGSITDPWQGPGQLVQTVDVRYLFVNMLKNIGTNIRHPLLTPIVRVYDNGVYFVARIIGVDVGNALISEVPGDKYILSVATSYTYTPDTAVNVLFFILLFISIFIGVIKLIKTKKFNCDYRFIATLTFILALCFIKWEPFMARYLLAYFGLAAPAIALQFEDISLNSKIDYLDVLGILACVMMLGSVYDYHLIQTYNPTNYDQRGQAYYTMNGNEYYTTYYHLKKYLKNVHVDKVGYYFYPQGQYSYPTFKLLSNHSDEIRFINVAKFKKKNKAVKYESKDYKPDMVVIACMKCPDDLEFSKYNGVEYSTEKISESVIIALPKENKE